MRLQLKVTVGAELSQIFETGTDTVDTLTDKFVGGGYVETGIGKAGIDA